MPVATTAETGHDIVSSRWRSFVPSAGNTITQVHQSLSVGKALQGALHDEAVDMAFLIIALFYWCETPQQQRNISAGR